MSSSGLYPPGASLLPVSLLARGSLSSTRFTVGQELNLPSLTRFTVGLELSLLTTRFTVGGQFSLRATIPVSLLVVVPARLAHQCFL